MNEVVNKECRKILNEAKNSLDNKYKFNSVYHQVTWLNYLEIDDPRLPFIKRIFLGDDEKNTDGVDLLFYPANTVEQAKPLFEKIRMNNNKFLSVIKQLSNKGYCISVHLKVGFAQSGYRIFTDYSFKDNNKNFLNYVDYFASNMDKIRGGYKDIDEIYSIAKKVNIEYSEDKIKDKKNLHILNYHKNARTHSPGLSLRPGFEISYNYGKNSNIESYKSDIISRIDEVLGVLLTL